MTHSMANICQAVTSFSSYDTVIELSLGPFWHENTECRALDIVVRSTGPGAIHEKTTESLTKCVQCM